MKCDRCGKETNDYRRIKPMDKTIKGMDEVLCQDCLEKEMEIWRQVENDTAYDYGYDGDGW